MKALQRNESSAEPSAACCLALLGEREAQKKAIVSAHCIDHAQLDKRLEVLARRPERFAQDALELCVALDTRGTDLEITDPSTWRSATTSLSATVENQFSTEVENIRAMGREEERRLALRIEFAKIRLSRAEEQHRLDKETLADVSDRLPALCRRRMEWHALRLEMAERNLYLVLINVERYRHTSADRSDLIQVAAATLLRAVDGYDWRHKVLFRTYAVHWLNQGFRSHLYNFNSTVRVPVYLQKSFKQINAAMQRLGTPHASVEEIARETGLPRSMIASARIAARTRRTRSLDTTLDSDGMYTLASALSLRDDEGPYSIALEDVSIQSAVQAALGRLTNRERRVVEMRFGLGCGRAHIYAEVADELGVSLERVRQILVRAMFKMRTPQMRKTLERLAT